MPLTPQQLCPIGDTGDLPKGMKRSFNSLGAKLVTALLIIVLLR